MGQLSDKDNTDLNDNNIGVVDKMEIELLSEKLEMNGGSEMGNGRSETIYRYTIEELIEIGKKPECQKELNNTVIKTCKLSKFDKSEIRERTMSLNRNLNSMESSARKYHVNNVGGAGMYRSKENGDHLILSQHFKSFNMGCHMPSMMHPNMASAFNRDFSGRGRAGSGRILSRDVPWDYRPDDGGTSNSGFNFRPGGGLMGLRESKRDFHRDEKFYSRDRDASFPYNCDQRYARQYSSSYGDRISSNYNSHAYDEEPEWFSGGPKSQHDIIELHGFDDDKNRSTHSLKSGKISYNETNESSTSDLQSELSKSNSSSSQKSSHRSSTPTKKTDQNNNEPNLCENVVPADVPIKQDFNFEDFLKLDSINGFVANDQFSRDNQSSRFSKWFRQDNSQKVEHECADKPVHSNSNTLDQSSSKHLSRSLLNLLQRSDSVVGSKSSSIQSVEEVEAKILQSKEFIPKSGSGLNLQNPNEGLAFKKLLAQIQQNQTAATAQTVFNPNIMPSVQQNSNYFNAALLNQQPHLNGLNLMKILSDQQMQFNLQQQQFLQTQQSLLLKQQLQQHNSHPSIQQAHQQEIYKKLILLDQIQKQQSQMNLSQSNLMYSSNIQQNRGESQYHGGNYRKPHTSQSHDQIYMNRNQMQLQQPQNYLSQPAFTPTSVRRHLAANIDKPTACNKQTEQQNNLLNNMNFNALATSDRANYETNVTSGNNREEAILHQPQLNAKPGRPILKGSQHHVQFAPTNYVQQ